MSVKPKRPSLGNVADYLVKQADPVSFTESAQVTDNETPMSKSSTAPAEMFRTSIYFARAVHDKLREIAFAERKTVSDLINEGLDHVLTSRNFATTDELRGKKR